MFLFTTEPRDFKGVVFWIWPFLHWLCTQFQDTISVTLQTSIFIKVTTSNYPNTKMIALWCRHDDVIGCQITGKYKLKCKYLKINKKSSVWDINLILLPNVKVREGLSSWHIAWPLWPLLPVKQEVVPHLKMVKARNMIFSPTIIV